MISAKIIADSVNPDGKRITTWVLTYPRFIHSEFMTHRAFSRNAASSRAIPVEKMLKSIEDNPALPEFWGANQKGMQAAHELSDVQKINAIACWLTTSCVAMAAVSHLLKLGLHKQLANRLLEPWAHMTVIATATEHHNFFALRAHPDAQPEFQTLAYRMLERYLQSNPVAKGWNEWHIPFGDRMPEGLSLIDRLKVATARCARISYLTFEGEIELVKDLELHDRLAASGHWSPFEHCARAGDFAEGNFDGWLQYRKDFGNENRTCVDLSAILATKPDWISLDEPQSTEA